MRIPATMFFFLLLGCSSDPTRTAPLRQEPWFQQIPVVAADDAGRCRPLSFVETHFNAAMEGPSISPEEERKTRRLAFDELERKVLHAGGNAVRMTVVREEGSAGAQQLGLYRIDLAGEALLCP